MFMTFFLAESLILCSSYAKWDYILVFGDEMNHAGFTERLNNYVFIINRWPNFPTIGILLR